VIDREWPGLVSPALASPLLRRLQLLLPFATTTIPPAALVFAAATFARPHKPPLPVAAVSAAAAALSMAL
jgi:hypothetical protein